jgi:hypothetical protein
MSQDPEADLQTTELDLKTSVGQPLFTPSQYSARSQSPAEALHSAVDFKSVGQVLVEPSHFSSKSHTPCEALQVKVFGCTASTGQVALDPLQVSATSHVPEADLHV